MASPIIICGCHGGGTSFITKALILNGLYCGHPNDRCPIANRKTHENYSFFNFIHSFYNEINQKYNIADPQSNIDRNIDIIKILLKESWQDRLAEIDINVSKTIKEYLNTDSPVKLANPWGWKNPRNAIMIPLWRYAFPEAKYLFVQKKRNGFKKRRTSEGRGHAKDFSEEFVNLHSSPTIYDQYIIKKNYRVVDFELFCSNYQYFNTIQKFIELSELDELSFSNLMAKSGLEK